MLSLRSKEIFCLNGGFCLQPRPNGTINCQCLTLVCSGRRLSIEIYELNPSFWLVNNSLFTMSPYVTEKLSIFAGYNLEGNFQ